MAGTAIYVDYHSLADGLHRQRSYYVAIQPLVDIFADEGARLGTIKSFRIYADWQRLFGVHTLLSQLQVEPRYLPPGCSEAYSEIAADINMLFGTGAVENILLVTHSPVYIPLVEHIRANSGIVTVCGIKKEIDPGLINAAHQVIPLDDFIDTLDSTQRPPRHFLLTSLIVAIEDLMLWLGTRHVPTQMVIETLNRLPNFSPHGEEWVNQALTERIFMQKDHPLDPESKLVFLNPQHPKVRQAFDLRDKLLMTLATTIQGSWFAYNRLERELRNLRSFGRTEHLRREWIDLLVNLNVITAELYQHPNQSNRPPTKGLKLNPDHPATANIMFQIELELKRLILLVNNFLIIRHYDWIAASTLIDILTEYITPITAQRIFSLAHTEEMLTVTKIKHQHYQTSVVHLNTQHPIVETTLAEQQQLLQLLHGLFEKQRTSLSAELIQNYLQEHHFGYSEEYRRFWVDFLIRSNFLRKSEWRTDQALKVFDFINTPLLRAIL